MKAWTHLLDKTGVFGSNPKNMFFVFVVVEEHIVYTVDERNPALVAPQPLINTKFWFSYLH